MMAFKPCRKKSRGVNDILVEFSQCSSHMSIKHIFLPVSFFLGRVGVITLQARNAMERPLFFPSEHTGPTYSREVIVATHGSEVNRLNMGENN